MSVDLSIYLIRESNQKNNEIVAEAEKLRHYPIDVGGERWSLYIKPGYPNPPRWARFFENRVDPGIFGQSSSPSAVLFVPAEGRLFALTFGAAGRSLLYPDAWEDRFGFKVTINAVNHKKLISLDKDRQAAEIRREREQTVRERTPDYFGVDPSRDIVRAVRGAPQNSAFGSRIEGRDHLRLTGVGVTLPGLPKLLERCYRKYHATTYQEHFAWVDHIGQVTEKSMIELLDEMLVDRLLEGELDNCLLSVPVVVEWNHIEGFKYSHSSFRNLRKEPSLEDFLESSKIGLNLDALKRRRVQAEDSVGTAIYTWSAYKCLVAEIEDNNETYVLNGGSWFKVASDFVAQVNDTVSLLPYINLPYLATYRSIDSSETEYNKRAAEESNGELAKMDKKNVRCPSATSPIEFCDLYHRGKELVHVKHYGASSVLSHLFFQALNSAEALLKDPGFRENVNERLPGSHRFESPRQEINPSDFRIIFAIISEKSGDLALPFFSRLSLRYVSEQLRLFRFRVALARIAMTKAAYR
jgi:uncharacterized protein (TIGR04141 family)